MGRSSEAYGKKTKHVIFWEELNEHLNDQLGSLSLSVNIFDEKWKSFKLRSQNWCHVQTKIAEKIATSVTKRKSEESLHNAKVSFNVVFALTYRQAKQIKTANTFCGKNVKFTMQSINSIGKYRLVKQIEALICFILHITTKENVN